MRGGSPGQAAGCRHGMRVFRMRGADEREARAGGGAVGAVQAMRPRDAPRRFPSGRRSARAGAARITDVGRTAAPSRRQLEPPHEVFREVQDLAGRSMPESPTIHAYPKFIPAKAQNFCAGLCCFRHSVVCDPVRRLSEDCIRMERKLGLSDRSVRRPSCKRGGRGRCGRAEPFAPI